MPADSFLDRLRTGRPPTYDVSRNGEIKGPLSFRGIQRSVYAGQLGLKDSYRQTGSAKWKSIGVALAKNRAFEVTLFGVYAIGIIVAGVWLGWCFRHLIDVDRNSSSWPWVEGRITFAQLESFPNIRSRFLPHVGYTYRVGSKSYFGETIYPECAFGGTERWAQSVIARHTSGSICRVYYPPRMPSSSRLEPGLAPHSYIIEGLSAMLIYTGTLLGCLAWSVWRRPIDRKPSLASALRSLFFIGTVIIGFFFVLWLP